MRIIKFQGWTILTLCFLVSTVDAKGVSPYLPLNVSPLLDNEIERLATIAGAPNLTKPYSMATISLYLEKVRTAYPHLYSRLKASLRPYYKQRSLTQLSASVKASDDHRVMPNQRGTFSDSQMAISFRGQWAFNDNLALFAGGNFTYYTADDVDNLYQASGSLLSLGVDWAQLDIGYKDFWLSPFQGSAQLLSTNGQTMPSISLSNNLPIETFGVKWNYQTFVAEMSRQEVQFKAGEFSNKDKPLLAGLHFSFQPTSWWSVGATRVFQFGGGERDVSFSTLVKALVDPRGADNDASIDEESGNQLASITSKINFDGRLPFSFTVELAGEDTSNNKAYQLGNTALTVGLFFPYFLSNDVSLTYEYSAWQNGWYVNNVYREGYTNDGFVLGNWAMQSQREAGTATEGVSHFLKTHWQRDNDDIVSAILRFSEHQDTNLVDYEDSWELQLDYSVPWSDNLMTFGAYFGQDNFGQSFTQINITVAYQ